MSLLRAAVAPVYLMVSRDHPITAISPAVKPQIFTISSAITRLAWHIMSAAQLSLAADHIRNSISRLRASGGLIAHGDV